MNTLKHAIWMFVALMCLASTGWYFASSKSSTRLDDTTLSTSVDTIIHHMVIQQYDKQGQLSHYLNTPLMTHTPQNDSHHLENPHIIVKKPNQPQWEIQAEKAISLYNGKQITFQGHVIIHQQDSAQKPASEIKTEELIYFPESQFATTQKQVEYQQQGSMVTAVGMNAFLDNNRIQLLSQAQGTYVPNQG